MNTRTLSMLMAFALLLAGSLSCVTSATAATPEGLRQDLSNLPGNRIEQLTGKVWQQSKLENKLACLFGVEMAIDVERSINATMSTKEAKKGHKAPTTLSPFERGWIRAFKDVPLREIVKRVDDWYASHPDKTDRLVMGVIWFELIEPALAGQHLS